MIDDPRTRTNTDEAAVEAQFGDPQAGPSREAEDSVDREPLAVDRHERIARRAYELHASRGAHGDGALQDWLQAEAEIDGEASRSAYL